MKASKKGWVADFMEPGLIELTFPDTEPGVEDNEHMLDTVS